MDQSQRAAPHGFSQLATSFLAYPRLGIPRAPLLRLAGVQKKNPKRALLLFQQPNLNVRTPYFLAALKPQAYWRSIQQHASRTNSQHASQSFQTQIFNQQNRLRGSPLAIQLKPALGRPSRQRIARAIRVHYFLRIESL